MSASQQKYNPTVATLTLQASTTTCARSRDEEEMHAGLTMESLRDLLHKKQADLLEEASNDETSDAEMSAASERALAAASKTLA